METTPIPDELDRGLIKRELFAALHFAGRSVARVFLDELIDGHIDGTTYGNSNKLYHNGGLCRCVYGHLLGRAPETARGFMSDLETEGLNIFVKQRSPVGSTYISSRLELFVEHVKPGATPETNDRLRLLRDWTREWLTLTYNPSSKK